VESKADPSPAPRLRLSTLVKAGLLALAVMFLAEVLRIFVGANFFTVVPGKCYRSGQPNAAFLEHAQRHYGIQAVFNLRDENVDAAWYQEEKEAAGRLGLKLVNAGLASKEQPPEKDFQHFVLSLRDCPEPMLIHCANGNDRTGLAAGMYLLLRTDATIPEARKQLSIRYGHFAVGKTLCLHRILDSYETWLAATNQEHSPDRLCHWAVHFYKQEPN
jgi:protein tyrosine phosphatase (PTP) superfamily phosphohydrolase (DUF442 family)